MLVMRSSLVLQRFEKKKKIFWKIISYRLEISLCDYQHEIQPIIIDDMIVLLMKIN